MKTNAQNHARQGQRKDSEAVFVSEPIGEGADAHRIVRVGEWEFTAPGTTGDNLLMPDTVLAERLGMPLRQLRELSGRHERAGNIAPQVYRTVRQTGGRPGAQRLYNEADALFIVTRSETPKAVALTREMIAVYMLARRGLLAPAVDGPAMASMVRSMMAEAGAALRAELIADLRAAQPANALTGPLPFLDRRAPHDVLNPITKMAYSYAGPGATARQMMRHRGQIDRRVRNAVDWHRKWCFFPVHRIGDLLAVVEGERVMAERVAMALMRERQLSLVPAPKPPSRGDA